MGWYKKFFGPASRYAMKAGLRYGIKRIFRSRRTRRRRLKGRRTRRRTPRRKSFRRGGAVGWIGRQQISNSSWRKRIRNKAEVYVKDYQWASHVPAAYQSGSSPAGQFAPLDNSTRGIDMSLQGWGVAPILQDPTGTAHNAAVNIRTGFSWNELGWKIRMCIESGSTTAASTCCRAILLEFKEEGTVALNGYEWDDFFSEEKITSFYRTRDETDGYNTPANYKILMDKQFVVNRETVQAERDLNIHIPAVKASTPKVDANRFSHSAPMANGNIRRVLFLVSDHDNTGAATMTPRFTSSVRMRWTDP